MAVTVVLSEIQRDTLAAAVRHLRAVDRARRRPDRLLGARGVGPGDPGRHRAGASASSPDEQLDGPARAARRARGRRASTRPPAGARGDRPRRSATPTPTRWPALSAFAGPHAPALLRAARSRDRAATPTGRRSATRARVSAPPSPDRRRRRSRSPCPATTTLTLEADVVVVGSGSGGGVIAGHARRRRARTSSCSRWAATTTRPTSTSSSCGPTRTSTAAAACTRPPTARSR